MNTFLVLIVSTIIVVLITIVITKYYISNKFNRKILLEKNEIIQEAFKDGHASAILEMERSLGISSLKE